MRVSEQNLRNSLTMARESSNLDLNVLSNLIQKTGNMLNNSANQKQKRRQTIVLQSGNSGLKSQDSRYSTFKRRQTRKSILIGDDSDLDSEEERVRH